MLWHWGSNEGSSRAEGEERPDRRQAGIPGAGAAAPDGFQVVEESQHQGFVEILHVQLVDALFPPVGRVAQEQSEGVTVGRNGVGGKTFHHRQVMTEKTLDRLRQAGTHAGSPWDLMCSR